MQQVDLKPKYIVKYAALPGIFPRLKTLFGGLNYLPFFLAQIYRNLGLLPLNHPYLDPNNQGRYGIISLMSVVINDLEFNTKNIDKIILLGTTIVGFVLFMLFGVGLLFSLMAGPAHALVTAVITDFPEEDIAFEILDRVFGVPDVFNSNYAPIPNPFHTGLHAMLEFYNIALFILASFVLLYYIFTIVGETAISGTLFGQRFNKVWGPLRIVIALGLLVPMGDYGLSSSQYILLYVAKYGSGLATNTWFGLNDTDDVFAPFAMNSTVAYGVDPYEFTDINGVTYTDGPFYVGGATYQSNGLIAHPAAPDVSGIAAHIDLIYTCMYAYKQAMDIDIRPWFVKTEGDETMSQLAIDGPIDPDAAVDFYNYNDIRVVFGDRHDDYVDYPGRVRPFCGDMIFPYKQETFPEMAQLRWLYYWLVMARFTDDDLTTVSGGATVGRPQRFAHKIVSHHVYPEVDDPTRTTPANLRPCGFGNGYAAGIGACDDPAIDSRHRAFIASELRREFLALSDFAISSFIEGDQSVFGPTARELDRGWAAAGLWYNKMSEWNGDVVSAVSGVPYPNKFPELMEKVKAQTIADNPKVVPDKVFELMVSGSRDVDLEGHEKKMYRAIMESYDYWNSDDANDNKNIASKANPFEGGLATIFGLTPILTIRDQNHVHPLAQLSGIGRNLIENAVTNLGLAFGASFIGGAKNAATDGTGAGYTGLSGFFTSLSYIGILLGVVLFYIIPFMPFLYSFFAASGWIKSIFEAMVGIPLWALAHLKIKGDGLIPREAISGYFLLMEIFIRPTLILFGLVATTAVFSAVVVVLNSIWDLVTANATGMNISADPTELSYYRNNVDQLFFLVLYIITVYMTATSVFKLIDQIPHSVIRWINASVKSFGDMAKDPAEGLYQYASMATYKFGPKMGEGVAGLGEAAGARSGLAEALKR